MPDVILNIGIFLNKNDYISIDIINRLEYDKNKRSAMPLKNWRNAKCQTKN